MVRIVVAQGCAMASVAAGTAAAAGLSTRASSAPLLLASNLSTSPNLKSLAPTSLYGLNSASSLTRPSGLLQLGFSRHLPRRGYSVVRSMASADLESSIKETVAKQPIVVYSKTYCPYCMRVKRLLGGLGYDFELVELDAGGAPPGLQDALERVSGQYTVPNVFIGGKHVGGCDDTLALHSRGQLLPLLQAAGALKN